MRRVFWAGAVVVAVFAIVGIVKREELIRLYSVVTLFDEDKAVYNFSHMDQLFNAVVMKTDTPPSPLTEGPPATMPAGFEHFVAETGVTSIVVLSQGEIVYQDYYQGTGPDDLRMSWSMAKSFLSALMGLVLEEGDIASLDDPVTKYVPDLVGTAYDGATIRDVAHMASGVWFDETYSDFNSDINKMSRVLALGGSLDDFTESLTETSAAPGEEWLYVSMDTHVLGMVIRGATGRRIPDLMQEKILGPMALEQDPEYLTDAHGNAFVLGGITMTARDYARFGQMIAQDGMWQGKQIVPADWIADFSAPTAPTAPGEFKYGLQWWLPIDPAPGEVFAVGLYGQYIWIDKAANVVIALNSANQGFTPGQVMIDNVDMLRNITKAVAR